MLRAALLAALTAVLAWVVIPLPFSLVPVTGQSLGVMLSAVFLPPRWAAFSMTIYVLLGAFGLPVYSGGSGGLGILAGPTGGYIWAFIPAAAVTSYLLNHVGSSGPWGRALVLMVGGVGAIYIPGLVQLGLVTGMDWLQTIMVGALPFLVGDALKVFLCWWLTGHKAIQMQRSRNQT